LGLAAAGCSPGNRPDSQAALEATVAAFYASAKDGGDPYTHHGGDKMAPFWTLLPLHAPAQVISAEVSLVAPVGGGSRDFRVQAALLVGSGDQKIAYLEETTWRYTSDAWILRAVAGIRLQLTSWAGNAPDAGGGLIAWEHAGAVFVLDAATGDVQRLVELVEAGVDSAGLFVGGWSPDGTALLLYSEDAAYLWQPRTAGGNEYQLTMICRLGNFGGANWSPDGRYVALDWGTDVIRSAEIVDVARGVILGTLGVYYGVAWGPEPGELYCTMPEHVDPPLAVHDGSSTSVARVRIVNGALATYRFAQGTTHDMYWMAGFGRDGSVIYSRNAVGEDGIPASGATWYRWDAEEERGVELTGGRPEMVSAEVSPTITVPAALRGTQPYVQEARVSIAPGGRWGVFAAPGADAAAGWGIYLIDLTAPAQYVRMASGMTPWWQPVGR